MKQVTVKLAEDAYVALRDLAERYGFTQAAVLRSAVNREVERIKRECKPLEDKDGV